MKSILFLITLNTILGQPDVNEMVKQHLLDHERLHGDKKTLQEANVEFNWRPIRIYIEFLGDYDKRWTDYVSSVLEISRTFLGKHLLIRQQVGTIQFGNGSTDCIGEVIPENLRMKEYDYDMVFFAKILNDPNSTYLAYAGPCSIQLLDNRPIFGGIVWNTMYTDLDNMNSMKFEQSVSTAIHEIIHGLGFISALYPYFIDHNTMKSYDNVTYYDDLKRMVLNTPRLTNISRNYFNCYNANGTVMENEASSATQESHFERTIFFNEIMTGSNMGGDFVVSIFTFMLLVDSGFYRLSSYESDPLYWGKNRGCDFVQKSCHIAHYPEFCDINGLGCSYNRNGIGLCSYDQLSDKCTYYAVGKGMDCRDSYTKSDNLGYQQFFQATNSDFGFNSKCLKGYIKQVESTLETDIGYSCYQYECQSDGQINVIVNGVTYDCSKGNTIISGSDTMNGQLLCPADPQLFCQISNECENQCNQRGFCVNKKCTCQPGYSGKSCENECLKYRDGINCVIQCAQQQYQDEYNLLCLNCSGNCLTCQSIDNCTKCEDGYYLNQQFCDPLTTVEYGAGLINPYLQATILRIILLIIIFN